LIYITPFIAGFVLALLTVHRRINRSDSFIAYVNNVLNSLYFVVAIAGLSFLFFGSGVYFTIFIWYLIGRMVFNLLVDYDDMDENWNELKDMRL
jgi:hypothetical protein